MSRVENEELKSMGLKELKLKVEELRKSLFELRLKSGVSHVKSFPSEQKRLKRSVARALTHLQHKESEKSKEKVKK